MPYIRRRRYGGKRPPRNGNKLPDGLPADPEDERASGLAGQSDPSATGAEDPANPGVPVEPGPHLDIRELQRTSIKALVKMAREDCHVENLSGLKKHELICEILKANARKNGTITGGGVVDILPESYGFLRSPQFNYQPCPEDLYVSPAQIRRYGLRKGEEVVGPVRAPRERERYFGLLEGQTVEGMTPEENLKKIPFDNLTALFPNRRILLESKNGDIAMRAMDLICPIGFGQRGLIVAPPRTGKTILLQKMANAIMENHPQAYLIMLLIDERPEEVTDMRRSVKGEVISSTFDEGPERHVQVAEMVMERAKRIVERKVDVIILLDSITRLARAHNALAGNSGRIMSGGVDSNALQKPKRFFGAARNCQEGGSLSIVATALIETGSRMDEVIFEEFKGTGNMEVNLDRSMSDQRIFPAINIPRSGTRKEELLYHPDEMQKIHILRKMMGQLPSGEAMTTLRDRLKKTNSNIEFLLSMGQWS
jgi:transcription termination factor Rho